MPNKTIVDYALRCAIAEEAKTGVIAECNQARADLVSFLVNNKMSWCLKPDWNAINNEKKYHSAS